MDVNITINASPELIEAIKTISNALVSAGIIMAAATEVSQKAIHVTAAAVDPMPEPASTFDAPDPVVEKPEITEVEIRAKFVNVSKKGKKTELKSLLTEMGVVKVSDLQPDQYQEAMAKLGAIK